jgi:hypothetical protein
MDFMCATCGEEGRLYSIENSVSTCGPMDARALPVPISLGLKTFTSYAVASTVFRKAIRSVAALRNPAFPDFQSW